MPAYLQEKRVSLMTRKAALTSIDAEDTVISVHEHLDREELFFDGVSIVYEQSFRQFSELFRTVSWEADEKPARILAAAFFSCPIYEKFRAVDIGNDLRAGIDIYRDLNIRVLEEIGALQHVFQNSAEPVAGDMRFLPLPFLFVDPNHTATDFERRYNKVFNQVAGLKWHPFAQNEVPSTYVRQGYLELAAKYGLPTVIHSERPGQQGDMAALLRDVSPVAEELKVPIDLAHMGFLHPDLDQITRYDYTYTDLSPWSGIYTGAHPEATPSERIESLAGYLEKYPNKILFGLDTPFNWLLWSDGKKFGAEISDEIDIVKSAAAQAGQGIDKRLFHINPIRFLNGLECDHI